jgi:hypothetical protein
VYLDRHFVCSSSALGSTKAIILSHFLYLFPCSASNSFSYFCFVIWRSRITHDGLFPFSFLAIYLGLFFRFLSCITCASPHGQAGRSYYWRCEVDIPYLLSFSHCLETATERALRWKGKLQRHCWHIAGLYETWCLEGWAEGWRARYLVYPIVFVILDGATDRALNRW